MFDKLQLQTGFRYRDAQLHMDEDLYSFCVMFKYTFRLQ